MDSEAKDRVAIDEECGTVTENVSPLSASCTVLKLSPQAANASEAKTIINEYAVFLMAISSCLPK